MHYQLYDNLKRKSFVEKKATTLNKPKILTKPLRAISQAVPPKNYITKTGINQFYAWNLSRENLFRTMDLNKDITGSSFKGYQYIYRYSKKKGGDLKQARS